MPRAIVIADDDADDRFILQRLLRRLKVLNPVQVFEHGEALLAHLRSCNGSGENAPCLIFLDIKMPRLNGFDVLEWLRQQGASTRLPVIVLSGSDEPSDRRQARALAATHYLTKHPSEDELKKLLDRFPDVVTAE